MKKVAIIKKVDSMSGNTKTIIRKILDTFIIENSYNKYICEDMLERIVLIYLSLFEGKNYLEIEDLTKYELGIIYKIFCKGIARIYLFNEYLSKDIIIKRKVIVNEIIDFLSILTGIDTDNIRISILKDMNNYYKNRNFS